MSYYNEKYSKKYAKNNKKLLILSGPDCNDKKTLIKKLENEIEENKNQFNIIKKNTINYQTNIVEKVSDFKNLPISDNYFVFNMN